MKRRRSFRRMRKNWDSLDPERRPSAVELREHNATKAGNPPVRETGAAARRRRQIEAGRLKPENGLGGP